MSNEELVEEILIEAHTLGLTTKVFEIVRLLSKEHTGSRRHQRYWRHYQLDFKRLAVRMFAR